MDKARTVLTAVLISMATALCEAEELSADSQALQRQLGLQLSAAIRTWVLTEAQRVHTDSQWEERQVRMDAQVQFVGQPVVGNDLDALVFLVYAEVVQQMDRRLIRPPTRTEPAKQVPEKKTVEKKKATATNTVTTATTRPEQELTDRRAKLLERANELGQKLWPLSQTLLQDIR
jgi:hypothetical protein